MSELGIYLEKESIKKQLIEEYNTKQISAEEAVKYAKELGLTEEELMEVGFWKNLGAKISGGLAAGQKAGQEKRMGKLDMLKAKAAAQVKKNTGKSVTALLRQKQKIEAKGDKLTQKDQGALNQINKMLAPYQKFIDKQADATQRIKTAQTELGAANLQKNLRQAQINLGKIIQDPKITSIASLRKKVTLYLNKLATIEQQQKKEVAGETLA